MNTLQKILLGIRLANMANASRALVYTLRRARLEAQYPARPDPSPPRPPYSSPCEHPLRGLARFHFEQDDLDVRFLAPDLLFLAWNGAAMLPSYALARTDWPYYSAVESPPLAEGWCLRTCALDLCVSPGGSLRLLSPGGQSLLQIDPPQSQPAGWQQKTRLAAGTHLYGLGERAGSLSLAAGRYRLWNNDAGGSYSPGHDPLYITMPVFWCLRDGTAVLVFYDNSWEGQVELQPGEVQTAFQGGPLRCYLACGSPQAVLQRFSELTGRPPLPPRWALGYHQSQWGYASEAEMRRVFQGFQAHRLPLSALYLDIDLLKEYRTLTVDEPRYPTLARFSAECRTAGVHLVANVNPGIKQESGFDLYEDGLAQDVFCKLPDGKPVSGVVWPGWACFPDFTDERVRTWWGRQHTRLLDYGIDGFWNDMNEPTSFTASGDMSLPRCTRHALDGHPGDHRQAHNLYGLLMNQAVYQGLRALQPAKRPFVLSRSGWVGMQRHAWTWTGDTHTSWDSLRQTVATVLGLSLCGVPYSGPDIGGFTGQPSPELYVRWFQLASFLPFFRTHSSFFLPRREPWQIDHTPAAKRLAESEGLPASGEDGPLLAILRACLELRGRLLPYWYTLAWQASQTGLPLVRPLFWADPADPGLYAVQDAFLLGDDLLVAPVLEEGARRRRIRLPKGDWYWASAMVAPTEPNLSSPPVGAGLAPAPGSDQPAHVAAAMVAPTEPNLSSPPAGAGLAPAPGSDQPAHVAAAMVAPTEPNLSSPPVGAGLAPALTNNGLLFHGPAEIEIEAPLNCIPLLVRAGAVIPTADGDELTLHFYRPLDGQPCEGWLYLDDGDGYGPSRVEHFQLLPQPDGSYTLARHSQGRYPFPYRQVNLR